MTLDARFAHSYYVMLHLIQTNMVLLLENLLTARHRCHYFFLKNAQNKYYHKLWKYSVLQTQKIYDFCYLVLTIMHKMQLVPMATLKRKLLLLSNCYPELSSQNVFTVVNNEIHLLRSKNIQTTLWDMHLSVMLHYDSHKHTFIYHGK